MGDGVSFEETLLVVEWANFREKATNQS